MLHLESRPGTGSFLLTLGNPGGDEESYVCKLAACQNPYCACTDLTLILAPFSPSSRARWSGSDRIQVTVDPSSRRLEADVKSLLALYEYRRLHGVPPALGSLDEMIPAPWVHRDEPRLFDLKQRAHELGAAIEVMAGSAPGWSDPWSRARRCQVEDDGSGFGLWLVDEDEFPVDDCDVQLARLATTNS